MAIGFDAGTYNLIASRRNQNNEIKYKKDVNCFLELPLENRFMFNMLKNAKVPIIEKEKVAYVVGQSAIDMAYTLPQLQLRRPMKEGCLNPHEKDAFRILNIMIHSLIGEVDKDREVLYYSVPANAVNTETDADWHSSVLKSIFKAYKVNGKTVQAFPINEGLALIFAELAEKNYTGIGISCLCPGTKIYTDKGIVDIEDVEVGDKVVGKTGNWDSVYNIIKKPFIGKKTKLTLNCVSHAGTNYQFVDNHKLFVKYDNGWKWLSCEAISIGDIVGEPIVRHNIEFAAPVVNLIERTTCSKSYKSRTIEVTPDFCRLFGLFLGDGSVSLAEGCIQFDFANNEEDNIKDIENLIERIFDKKAARIKRRENCTRVKCYSKSLARWFKENCYRAKEKRFPFTLEEIDDECCRQLAMGLINSDGAIGKNSIYFYNSNSALIHLCRQALGRCGVAASVNMRPPRKPSLCRGRIINGKKNEWTVGSASPTIKTAFPEYKFDDFPLIRRSRVWIEDGFICSRVKSIEYSYYEGEVYDLQVANSHSFSGPGLTISNCGSGMINLCYAIFSTPVFQMSLVNAGDWIDKMAGKASGESPNVINKEKLKIDLNKSPSNLVERAIRTQYELLVQKAVSAIKKAIQEAGTKAHTEAPLDIIVAGGTASPPGFIELFGNTVKESGWDIPVGEIKRPNDFLYSVARGVLVAAENSQM